MPECGQQLLIDGGKCFRNLDSQSRRALKVYAMMQQLAAIGGTAYTEATLNAAATEYCGLNADRDLINLAWIVIEVNNAREAGATISEDIQAIAEAIKCLKNYPAWKLTLMELLLRCELGQSATQ